MDVDPNIAANAKLVMAAGLGGMVRMFLRPAKSLAQGAMLLLSCGACGFYATPPFMAWSQTPVDQVGAVGAFFGLIGLSLAEALLRGVDSLDLRGVIASMLKGKAG